MSLSIGSGSDGGGSSLLRALQATHRRLDRTFTHLATGKRIAAARDDAAGLAIATRLASQSRGLAQGERNLADGIGYAQTAEGTLQSHHDTLGRLRELSIQAQNGTLSDGDRQTIQQEFDQLTASLDQTAASASFAGEPLLDGSNSGSGAATFTDGRGGGVAVDLPAMDSSSLGVSGLSAADPTALGAIDRAIGDVSRLRSSLGAAMQQMEHRATSLAAQRENTEAARSRIEDADYAQEVADLTRDRILHEMQATGLQVHGRHGRAVLDLLG